METKYRNFDDVCCGKKDMAVEREFSSYMESCVGVLSIPYKKFFEILDGYLNIGLWIFKITEADACDQHQPQKIWTMHVHLAN